MDDDVVDTVDFLYDPLLIGSSGRCVYSDNIQTYRYIEDDKECFMN